MPSQVMRSGGYYVFTMSRTIMDSSAGRASPFHTCSNRNIIMTACGFSSLVCLVNVSLLIHVRIALTELDRFDIVNPRNIVDLIILKTFTFLTDCGFYRVMRCIARTMPSEDVRLSVRPSIRHTPVFYQNAKTYHQTFSSSGSHTILVFPNQMVWQYSDGNLLSGVVQCRRYKNLDLRPISRFVSDTAIDTMECK